MDTRTNHALIRFGLGPRHGETPPRDPEAWLAAQLNGPDPVLAIPAPSVADGIRLLHYDREDSRLRGAEPIRRVGAMFAAEMTAITNNLLNTPVPFRERLVWFWANHFTVSLRFGGEIMALIPSYIREAIRPHVTGRFGDMLSAVMHHPAMLTYLDNIVSAGPDSLIGRKLNRGINENLARESLELHTVTPAAGYTQNDVTEYAKIMTGWTSEVREFSGFTFRADGHQPGPKTVMGRTFPAGLEGGEQMLAFLAAHPMTHRNIATKFVRHFVADDPPAGAVRRIETVLHDTSGDLRAASLATAALPDAWKSLTKIRSPAEYVFAVLRGLGATAFPATELGSALDVLGEPRFLAPFPNGYPDIAAAWTSGEALMRRVDWVFRQMPYYTALSAEDLAKELLGGLLSSETLNQIQHAASARDALTLLLTSPEFIRR